MGGTERDGRLNMEVKLFYAPRAPSRGISNLFFKRICLSVHRMKLMLARIKNETDKNIKLYFYQLALCSFGAWDQKKLI